MLCSDLSSEAQINLNISREPAAENEQFIPIEYKYNEEEETIETDSDLSEEKDIPPKKRNYTKAKVKEQRDSDLGRSHNENDVKEKRLPSPYKQRYRRITLSPKITLREFVRPKSHFFRVAKRRKTEPIPKECDTCQKMEILIADLYPVLKKLVKFSPLLRDVIHQSQG